MKSGVAVVLPWVAAWPVGAQEFGGDPYRSHQWEGIRKEFFGSAPLRFDDRVQVRGPAFAEDPMNVAVSVSVAPSVGEVEQIVVIVDRNPIRKVLEYFPVRATPAVGFRFKLEQASPVRAAVKLRDGAWLVGGTWVDSSGGGCTVSGATRKDGSWAQTLGQVSARVFTSDATTASLAPGATPIFSGQRLRLRVMHPMDTGLVGGVPAFYLARLAVRDAQDRELLRLNTFEPVSENPVFSFDFDRREPGALRVVGVDNNGNRIDTVVP